MRTLRTATTKTELNDHEWLLESIGAVTDERVMLEVHEWAANKRRLTKALTPRPGAFDNSYTPYLIEIMDCLGPLSSVTELAVMKGVQIGFTTGVLENGVGFSIDHFPGPGMMISADAEVTKQGMELRVDAMIESAGLADRIHASNPRAKRSGDTATRKEFAGGFWLAIGGRSPGKIRSISIKNMYVDELDALPDLLGQAGNEEGRTIDVIRGRTKAFESVRKILWGSTPLVMETSKIAGLYEIGDKRKFFIPCVHCGEMQFLDWKGVHEDGRRYGMVWDLDVHGHLDYASVGYACIACGAIMRDYHKSEFLPRGEWRPTAIAQRRNFRSYHLPALLSPPGMHSWEGVVETFSEAWDLKNDRPKDVESLRSFYNLELGLPWEERGGAPSFERVIEHRRAIYMSGEVPNEYIVKETGAPGVFVTGAVDVHGDRLDVHTLIWCKDRQSYSLEWLHFEGDTDNTGPEGPWQELRDLIERKVYTADDGREYRIMLTLVDAGWKGDVVHGFCQEYSQGVIGVQGRELSGIGSRFREFDTFESKFGGFGFNITSTHYKNRLVVWLKSMWDAGQTQPLGRPNYPNDFGDDYFRQYEGETKEKVIDKKTKKVRGWFWRPRGQRPNHAWDCMVYNMAAYDIHVWVTCRDQLGLDAIDYIHFNEYAVPRRDVENRWIVSPFSWIEGQVAPR